MLSIEQIAHKVAGLKARNAGRDGRMGDITAVRKGQIAAIAPDFFPEGMSQPMIANFVDVAARDLAEVLAPLPSLNCSTTNITSDKAKQFADKRTLIANNYVQHSRLQTQMYQGADWYLTYGFLPIVVEPDTESGLPRIRVENPVGSYPEFDRYNRCVSFTKRYVKTLGELVVDFPEYESQLIGRHGRDMVDYNSLVELVRYRDKDQEVLFVPARGDLLLRRIENPMGELLVRVAFKPGIDDEPRGQFDDIMWVQLARARFSLLAMEAAEKSVQAPLAVPSDVQEFAFGPDAVLRSQNPQGIRRVGLELPTGAFTEQALLQQEMRLGARYPEGRTGNLDASIITGSGVQALMGGFDTQIKAGQQVLADTFDDIIGLCFKVDESLFDFDKTVRGLHQGAPYEIKYRPSKDIKGDHSVEIRYGLMSGLDPNRALIFSLQALGAGLVSKDFVMRELPWAMNVSKEQERIDIEKNREALAASIGALAQVIPAMASQGADPTPIIQKIAQVIDQRRNGKAIEDAVLDVFKPVEPETPEPGQPEQPAPPPGPEAGMPMAGPGGGGGDIAGLLAQLGA